MFQFIIRALSTTLAYEPYRKIFAKGQYRTTSSYLNAMMITARDFGHKFKYTNHHKAIWKGVNPLAEFKPEHYKVGCFG